jgi:hypothetical protein
VLFVLYICWYDNVSTEVVGMIMLVLRLACDQVVCLRSMPSSFA